MTTDPMNDPLYQLGLPPILVQRFRGLEDNARQFEIGLSAMGSSHAQEKTKLATAGEKIETILAPAVETLRGDFQGMAAQIDSVKQMILNEVVNRGNALTALSIRVKDLSDHVVHEIAKIRTDVAADDRWQVGQQQLTAECSEIRAS